MNYTIVGVSNPNTASPNGTALAGQLNWEYQNPPGGFLYRHNGTANPQPWIKVGIVTSIGVGQIVVIRD
jgi:hypothetical protein